MSCPKSWHKDQGRLTNLARKKLNAYTSPCPHYALLSLDTHLVSLFCPCPRIMAHCKCREKSQRDVLEFFCKRERHLNTFAIGTLYISVHFDQDKENTADDHAVSLYTHQGEIRPILYIVEMISVMLMLDCECPVPLTVIKSLLSSIEMIAFITMLECDNGTHSGQSRGCRGEGTLSGQSR